MAYYSNEELTRFNFKKLGKNVKIGTLTSIHRPELISIGDNSRIDDFCAISGNVEVGNNVHIAVHCSITASKERVKFEDFSGLAFACHIFSSSDDYSGESLTNPTIPAQFKNVSHGEVLIGKHSIVGTGSVIFPGVSLAEGTAVGALSVVTKSTAPWGIYLGSPARRVKNRTQELLKLETQYLSGIEGDVE
jgi:galactoside O-acetyltransferase